MTWLLLALIALCYPFSDALRWQGEWWQLVTYGFTHANLVHLAINAIALWSFAGAVEKLRGPWPVLGVFMLGSLWGVELQAIVTPGLMLSGASAGIFALFAACAILKPEARVFFAGVIKFQAADALSVLLIASSMCLYFHWLPSIAHAAHLGGMIAGYFYGTVVNRLP